MFKFLKAKLKSTVAKISEKVEEEGKEEVFEEAKEETVSVPVEEVREEKKGFFAKLKDKFTKKEEAVEEEEGYKEVETVSAPIKEVEEESVTAEVKEEEPLPEPVDEDEEGYKEIKEEELKEEIKEIPVKIVEPKKKIKIEEKIKKGEIPTVQELAERKKEEEAQKVEIKEVKSFDDEEIQKQIIKEQKKKEEERKNEEPQQEAEGFFSRLKQKIVTKKINEHQFEEMFWDLEVGLLENNVAVEVIDKIKKDLKTNLVDRPIPRGGVYNVITASLKSSINGLFDVEQIDLLKKVKEKKPYIICFFGINGSGKTTTIAKIAKMLQNNGLKSVLVAADTWRAAAIEQLQLHADKLGVRMIRHDYGSDPAAVAFDGISYAKAKGLDAVLIDTAGRMHSNNNLLEEMKKIIRVAKPDFKIFVGESITGNDCTEQAQKFNEAVGIDGVILTKADVDEKGGAAISVSYVTGKPILFLGSGQNYSDIKVFDSEEIVESIGLES